ncbi:MAG: putative DNA binding domain-containing protein [Oscillospiraceae bacterium]|nr:putative DNA binding domain-containing protein [Oscillospiraceae bacterium]
MNLEELRRGETKNVEFKVELPKKAERYTKTLVAFANTQGGKLVIGVDDDTHEVVGVDADDLFEVMDSIANVVSASCEPQIIPDITLQTTEDGKTLVIVTVAPGANRPYYLKAEGRDNGTYIRVAGTTRHASPEKIRELILEGARASWDEQPCIGFEVTDNQIEALCADIQAYRKKAGLPDRAVTRTQLMNWKLLKETDGKFQASNGFVLLTSDWFQFSKTQCAVFKGERGSAFLDKRTYDGPVYRQIDEAVEFVLRNIRLRAEIVGLLRRERYELPEEAIREMITNAHCHRQWTAESCIQVAIYDDRLEVTSPGGLYNGLTYEEMIQGHSRLRNRALANVLNQMGLIESWGTGILRIRQLAREYGLPEPEFIESDNFFRVNLRRSSEIDGDMTEKKKDSSEKFGDNSEIAKNGSEIFGDNSGKITELEGKILQIIRADPTVSAKKIAEELFVTSRTVEKNISTLKTKRILTRHGTKGGYWEILEHESTTIVD